MKKNNLILFNKILKTENSAYIIDLDHFQNNLIKMQNAFLKYYPKVCLAYSYKTNYVPSVCKKAHELGAFAEVVSEMEVEMALKNLKTNKNKIIYNGPIKTKLSIEKIIKANGIINLDGMHDFSKIDEIISFKYFKKYKVNVALRINLTYRNNKSRFGMDYKELDLVLNKIINNNRFNFLGFHVHLPFRSINSFKYRIDKITDILKKYKNINVHSINIGGGFYGTISKNLLLSLKLNNIPKYDDYARIVGNKLSNFFKLSNIKNLPLLIFEPGSSVIADPVFFISKIHCLKKINNDNNIITYAARHLLIPTNKNIYLPVYIACNKNNVLLNENFKKNKYLVSGYTCIESDIIGEFKSNKIINEKDNYVIFSNVGSYSIVMAGDFILPRPSIFSIQNGKINIEKKSKKNNEIIFDFNN